MKKEEETKTTTMMMKKNTTKEKAIFRKSAFGNILICFVQPIKSKTSNNVYFIAPS